MTLRARAIGLGVVVVLAGALAWTYRVRPPGPKDDPVYTGLQAEEKALVGFDGPTVARLRAERDALARKVTAPPLVEVQSVLGPKWTWTPAGEGVFSAVARGDGTDDWPAMLAGLGALERQPGVFLEAVWFAGDGRRLLQAKLTVRVRAGSNPMKTKSP